MESEPTESQIFNEARKMLSQEEQEAYLDKNCGNDAKLRARIANLLVAFFQESEFLERPAFETSQTGELGTEKVPEKIGRFNIKKVLGEGVFGCVYLGFDTKLEREVAVKIPWQKFVRSQELVDHYFSEARALASLDHPNIVPVYAVGSTETIPCYLVSKYIEGRDLANRLKESPPLTMVQSVNIATTIAKALHHAHKRGFVHRQIKPENILVDNQEMPGVVDFGMARCDFELGNVLQQCAGTHSYISPEQARGEGHRIDGRSDIFSLGAVLYRMLVGHSPFRASSTTELLTEIVTTEPKPICQCDESIPKELELIVSKAMAKRVADRYRTANDFGDDLLELLSKDCK